MRRWSDECGRGKARVLRLGALKLRNVVAAVVGVLVTLTACGGQTSPSPMLQSAGADDPVGVSMPAVHPNMPWLFGTFGLCLNKAGSVTPTDLTLVHPINSMRIVDWGLHPGQGGVGALPGTVKDAPGSTHDPVTAVCDGGSVTGVALNVSVESTDPTFTWARGFLLHYRSGGHARTLYVPFYIELCSTPTNKPCDHMDFNAKP